MEIIPTQRTDVKHKNGHSLKTHCHVGHPFTPENTYISPKRQKRECRTCRKTYWHKNLAENREKSRLKQQKWRELNRALNNKYWVDRRVEKKAWVDAYKAEHPCVKCGEADPVCLDFHHIDPTQKKFLIALAVARASLKRIQEEIAKCEILCANCHRKLHAAERAAKES